MKIVMKFFSFSEPFPSFIAFLHGVDKSIAKLIFRQWIVYHSGRQNSVLLPSGCSCTNSQDLKLCYMAKETLQICMVELAYNSKSEQV